MNDTNYIKHDNYSNFGTVKYIDWTTYSTFIPVPKKKHYKKYNKNQLSLFNLNNEAF